MIVLFKNKPYKLDMPLILFEGLKRRGYNYEVEITEITISFYKKVVKVSIKDIEIYPKDKKNFSNIRNLDAMH